MSGLCSSIRHQNSNGFICLQIIESTIFFNGICNEKKKHTVFVNNTRSTELISQYCQCLFRIPVFLSLDHI